jgi:hypothetical protein
MEKIKSLLWFGGKVVIALAILNVLSMALLNKDFYDLIVDPMGSIKSKFGG